MSKKNFLQLCTYSLDLQYFEMKKDRDPEWLKKKFGFFISDFVKEFSTRTLNFAFLLWILKIWFWISREVM